VGCLTGSTHNPYHVCRPLNQLFVKVGVLAARVTNVATASDAACMQLAMAWRALLCCAPTAMACSLASAHPDACPRTLRFLFSAHARLLPHAGPLLQRCMRGDWSRPYETMDAGSVANHLLQSLSLAADYVGSSWARESVGTAGDVLDSAPGWADLLDAVVAVIEGRAEASAAAVPAGVSPLRSTLSKLERGGDGWVGWGVGGWSLLHGGWGELVAWVAIDSVQNLIRVLS
jgi:hypothetical protein